MSAQGLERVETTYRRYRSRWAWYALSLAGFQGWEPSLRRRTVDHLQLGPGDEVLDLACGRGSNFPFLQRVIGPNGRVVGVDYSPEMLAAAEALVRRKRWTNVELVHADAAQLGYRAAFDGALCTIAMTVIPDWHAALYNLVAAVRPGKRVAIMDGRAGGYPRIATPFARAFARLTAAELDRDVAAAARALLTNVREETRMFGIYFVLSGEPRRDV
jgi:demethylmenaquinone methyltransferase/2-methoxy-6-polyprenyl-1,4-benzoquinol methylase